MAGAQSLTPVTVILLNSFDDESILLQLPAHTSLRKLRRVIRRNLSLPEGQPFDNLHVVLGVPSERMLSFSDENKGMDHMRLKDVKHDPRTGDTVKVEVFVPSSVPHPHLLRNGRMWWKT
jgi:hypothetical protein